MKTFTFDYPVRHDDLDFMAIIGNAEWITILTRARIELLDRINTLTSTQQIFVI